MSCKASLNGSAALIGCNFGPKFEQPPVGFVKNHIDPRLQNVISEQLALERLVPHGRKPVVRPKGKTEIIVSFGSATYFMYSSCKWIPYVFCRGSV